MRIAALSLVVLVALLTACGKQEVTPQQTAAPSSKQGAPQPPAKPWSCPKDTSGYVNCMPPTDDPDCRGEYRQFLEKCGVKFAD